MREILECVSAYEYVSMQESANLCQHVSVPTGVHVCGAGSEGYSWTGAHKHASAYKREHKRVSLAAQA